MASGSPDAAMTAFVDAFRRLPTNDSRRRALEALAGELSPYEWRTMHALTSARSFHHDIVGSLPLELVALVFGYLDTSTPYRLQLVSRRWNHVLRSLDVLKAGLNVWYRGSVDLSNADHASCERKARSVHRLRYGIPSGTFRLELDIFPHAYSLVGNLLIWLPWDVRAIHVLSLDTWKLHSLHGEGREQIFRFRASDQLIAMTTRSNVCYVSMLDGQGRRSFKMPSRHFSLHACRGRTVAFAACLEDHITIFIWNYDTQLGTSFDISRHPSHDFFAPDIPPQHRHNINLLLQPETETVVAIGAVVCPQGHDKCSCDKTKRILCGRFTYEGQCIHSSHLPPQDHVGIASMCDDWQITPVDRNGLVHVVGVKREDMRPVAIQYDERLDGFVEIHGPASDPRLCVNAHTIWWNDTFYQIRHEVNHPYLVLSGTSERSIGKQLVTLPSELRIPKKDAKSITMNDNYVIYDVAGGFYIHSFEPSDSHPLTNGTFGSIAKWGVL